MTPRVGVKTTPAIETRLPGLPIPSGSPIFLFTGLHCLDFAVPDEAAKTDPVGSAQFTLRVTAMRA